jgi:hypothetical protein
MQPLSVTATVNPGAYLTNAALFLDVNQSAVTPAAVPAPPPAPAAVVQVNNGFGSSITTVPGGGGAGFSHTKVFSTCHQSGWLLWTKVGLTAQHARA